MKVYDMPGFRRAVRRFRRRTRRRPHPAYLRKED